MDSKSIDNEAELTSAVVDVIKDLGLFGQQVPKEYGKLLYIYIIVSCSENSKNCKTIKIAY